MKSTILPICPVFWSEDKVLLIDQTMLPHEYALVEITCYEDMAEAIKTMVVRGAPAIGIAAAYGMYLGARAIQPQQVDKFLIHLEIVA